MRLIFIRHGKTQGNIEHRYIGHTDESLCEEGIIELEKTTFLPDKVYVSPMKRCVETARILFPDKELIEISDFREYDFGKFEGKNYEELKNDLDYQKWLESNGELPFPAGEGMKHFKNRVCNAFEKLLGELQDETIAFVVHGGTIMSIFEKYDSEHLGYYDYQCKNGQGYEADWDGTFPCRLVRR